MSHIVSLATKGNEIFIAFRGERFPRMLQRWPFNLHAITVSYRVFGTLFLFSIFLLLSFYSHSWNTVSSRMQKCFFAFTIATGDMFPRVVWIKFLILNDAAGWHSSSSNSTFARRPRNSIISEQTRRTRH